MDALRCPLTYLISYQFEASPVTSTCINDWRARRWRGRRDTWRPASPEGSPCPSQWPSRYCTRGTHRPPDPSMRCNPSHQHRRRLYCQLPPLRAQTMEELFACWSYRVNFFYIFTYSSRIRLWNRRVGMWVHHWLCWLHVRHRLTICLLWETSFN